MTCIGIIEYYVHVSMVLWVRKELNILLIRNSSYFCRRRRAAGTGGRTSSRRSRSSHRSRSGGGRRAGQGGRQGAASRSPTRHRHREGRPHGDRGLSAEAEAKRSQIEAWPHSQSFLFAILGVVLGMFSINRFVILTLDFGGES